MDKNALEKATARTVSAAQSALTGTRPFSPMRLLPFLEPAFVASIAFSSELVRGDPTKAIVSAIHKRRPDLVVLGTHGKAGLDALFEGSVGAKICATSNVPVLLAPAKNP